ncbi:MAG: M55 family metallopeptidase [Niameybacter sp.]|uniref:M55 family metallopeptidase n=1 Tax=Niameybacter sp. TaxID=2033640 RepID=UPI002FCB0209
MRIFITADIEGITGISNWKLADDTPPQEARERMTGEVVAACKGAMAAGALDFVIKDAHGNGYNLIQEQLPKNAKLMSGWSNHPYNMVEGLDDTFDGIVFIGYHSNGLANTSPLSHTLFPKMIRGIYLNDEPASEFTLYAYVAYLLSVPIIAVTGDGGLIRTVGEFDPTIKTVAVQEGFGGGMVSIHPELAKERIENAVKQSLSELKTVGWSSNVSIPEVFNLKVVFNRHEDAYKYSFYPNARQIDEFTISYTTDNYMDLLTLLLFM